MEQYILKSALVAEIEKLEKLYCYGKSDGMLIAKSVFDSIKNIIDTLEVKEVNLKKDSLTWKDINLIDHLLFDIKEDYDNGKLDKEEYYKEVLKKFKEQL